MVTTTFATYWLTSLTDPAVKVSYGYTGTDSLSSFTDGNDKTTHYSYSGTDDLQLHTIVDPDTHTIVVTYESTTSTQVKSVTFKTGTASDTYSFSYGTYSLTGGHWEKTDTLTDPDTHTTTYVVDTSDRPLSVTNALDQKRSATWNTHSQVTTLVDVQANPGKTAFSYTLDNLSEVTSPGMATTSTLRVELGYKTSANTGLVTSDTDPQGNCTAYTYDTAGNMLASYEGLSGGTAHTCSGQTNSYDYKDTYWGYTGVGATTPHTKTCNGLKGELCSTTNPASHTTRYVYYADGNLKTVIPPSPQGKTSYTYDTVNRPTTITSPTGTVHITYDGDNRIKKLAYTAGPTITYTYDGDGNVTQRVDPTGTTKFKYNTGNELIRETLPGTVDACSGVAYMKACLQQGR